MTNAHVAHAMTLHRELIVVDAHNDLLMQVSRYAVDRQAGHFRQHWLPQLRAAGIDVQVLPVFVEPDYRPEGALRQTLNMIETAWRCAEGCHDLAEICLTGNDIDRAVGDGRIALVLALEGCEAIGVDVQLLEVLFRLGVRIASFTHLGRTMLADGSAEDDAGGRLTRAGVEAVEICEQLGLLLDVSHLGAASTDHLLSIASRPVIASHSSAFAVHAHHRNLTDERLRAIAELGGVVGVNVLAAFVGEHDPTVADVADHVAHLAQVMGPEHVGLGPDFIRSVSEALRRRDEPDWGARLPYHYVPGLDGPAGLPLLTAELLRRGWTETALADVLGASFLRLFRAELGQSRTTRASHRWADADGVDGAR